MNTAKPSGAVFHPIWGIKPRFFGAMAALQTTAIPPGIAVVCSAVPWPEMHDPSSAARLAQGLLKNNASGTFSVDRP